VRICAPTPLIDPRILASLMERHASSPVTVSWAGGVDLCGRFKIISLRDTCE